MNRRFACPWLLGADGWVADQVMGVDDAGFIADLAPDRGQAVNERLAGPVIPGMPNVHSHAFQRLVAGLGGRRAGSESFWTWREAMYRVAERVDPEDLEAVASGLYLDLLRGGYTSMGEFHYLHHAPGGAPYADLGEMAGRICAAADRVGIALTLLPVLYCRAGFGAKGVEAGQRRFQNDPDRFARLLESCRTRVEMHPLQRIGVAPHSLRAVNVHELNACLSLAECDEPLHIHVAEQPAEVSACLAHHGARSLAFLLTQVDLDARWCLVHATHLDDEELHAGAASGAVAGLCPSTEADLGDGIFRARDWAGAGGAWGVGSDSNLRLDAAEELRLLEFSQRLRDGGRHLLARSGESSGTSLWATAAAGGAQALAQPVGCLAPGRRADFLVLDAEHPLLAELGADDQLNTLVFAGDGRMLESVWVAGVRRILRGRHEREQGVSASSDASLRSLRR